MYVHIGFRSVWYTMFQDEGARDGGESVLVGTQSGTEEKASADTEMEEIPSPVPSTSVQVCLVLIVTYCFP